ncbi:CRTAC1 family protein [Akkermansiaceae bacterium]|nr:CRTAC1 family protein [Akkermansiaceae bacterium]
MSQPHNRNSEIKALGEIDAEAGEFWVENPFMMPSIRANLSAYEQNRTFLNLDGKSFLDVSFATGADLDSDSRSAITADFNRDGAPDLLVASVGGGPLRLFLNRYPVGNHVRLKIVGQKSNRLGIGTRLVAEVGDRKIVRDVFPPNGFMGQGPVEVIIGLGEAQEIDRLSLRWPTQITQVVSDLKAEETYELIEGEVLKKGK